MVNGIGLIKTTLIKTYIREIENFIEAEKKKYTKNSRSDIQAGFSQIH